MNIGNILWSSKMLLDPVGIEPATSWSPVEHTRATKASKDNEDTDQTVHDSHDIY